MALKESGPAADWREIDRWDGGVGWIAHPDEHIQRASHALVDDGDVWVVDPLDVAGLDDLLAEFGTVAGVVVLLDRHTRDADVVAARHDVPVYVPEWMSRTIEALESPVEPVHLQLADTGYGLHRVVDIPTWHEAALFGEDDGVLVVADAMGTVEYFLGGAERIGIHPLLRLTPPNRLARLDPDRILCGHGAGIHEDVADAFETAFDGTRRRAPGVWARGILGLLR